MATAPNEALPSHQEQLHFLTMLQRVLSEGSFVSTYKFALLMALADLSVERGTDTGAALPLPILAIAEKIIGLYWVQVIPFAPLGHSEEAAVLQQNTGRQASIVALVAQARREEASLAGFRGDASRWARLQKKVADVLVEMPIGKLQTLGRQQVPFLYDYDVSDRQTDLLLKPGVAYCFRAFLPLVRDLIQGAWIRFLRRVPSNRPLLGEAQELGDFLFGSERTTLAAYPPLLGPLQRGQCFYCQGSLRGGSEVDHFVPWSLYSVDLGHNMVLAHGTCNRDKSDRLAAVRHLERWLRRNEDHRDELVQAFDAAGLVHSGGVSHKVAGWAYGQAEAAGSQLWDATPNILVPLDVRWRGLLHPSVAP